MKLHYYTDMIIQICPRHAQCQLEIILSALSQLTRSPRTMGDNTQCKLATVKWDKPNKRQATSKQPRTTEQLNNRQPHGHLKRLISCLNAHKSHQIHWKQHLALRLRFVVIVTGSGGKERERERRGEWRVWAFNFFVAIKRGDFSSSATRRVINKSGDDVHCVLAASRLSPCCLLPSGKRQTNDSWLDKHLDGVGVGVGVGGGTKRASNGKLWNYAIRFRTHRQMRLSSLPSVPASRESNEVVFGKRVILARW